MVTTAPTRAIEIVRRSGIQYAVHEYEPAERHGRDRDARPAYGIEAAAALGVPPERVLKTLLAVVDDRLVLAVIPAAAELDLKRLASAFGARRASLADAAVAERATGQVVGGISPLGSRRPLPVVVEAAARAHPTVFVSAGRRGLQLELAPDDLVRLCTAPWTSICRDQGPG
jgi:Cys-tRNA(Pro)/Cys-tRNA(Cys) deacylase